MGVFGGLKLWRAAVFCVLSVFLVCFFGQAGRGFAQDASITVILRQGQSDQDIAQILDAAGKTGKAVTVRWEDAVASAAAAPATASASGSQTQAAAASAPDMADQLANGFEMGMDGVSGIADVQKGLAATLAREGGSATGTVALAVLSALAGVGAAGLVWWFFRRFSRPRLPAVHLLHRVRGSALLLVSDLLCLAAFALAAHGVLHRLLPGGTVSFMLARSILNVFIVGGAYAIAGRFLFSPSRASTRLIAIGHPAWHWAMLTAYGTIGAMLGESVRFAAMQSLNSSAVEGWFLIGASLLTVLKLWWFLAGRQDIRQVFAGADPGNVRRAIAFILPEFYALTAVLLWIVGLLVAGTANSAVWSFAAGATQVILLVIPIIALGAYSIAGAIAFYSFRAERTAVAIAAVTAVQTALAGAVWLAGLHLISTLWRPIMMQEGVATAVQWVVILERVSLAVVASWVICSFLWACFEHLSPTTKLALPGEEAIEGGAAVSRATRLSTVLPLVRNLSLGAIVAITSLVILSSLGIDVAPLLAGFGVLGLALSFGSQALVKDVVSGIFFIADDAFRLGEYLDTGKLKGTVEHISIRSIRLRHQNGQIHTIPFGQLQAVTNFSRDWSTIKFELRFDPSANPELIRKTVKKVGLAMLEDPELGPEFLVPLKLQGIQDVTENSLVVRLKFTCKPGNPSILQREAMKRLLPALKAAGLDLASNAVTVRSGANRDIVDGAAASVTIAKAATDQEVAV